MPRKRQVSQATEEGLDIASKMLANIDAVQLRAILKREKTFTFRLSDVDRESIDKAAKAMDLSGAEYLLRIHWLVYRELEKAGVMK